jgi:HD-GYP domain-containing protein (c-di-GMP phosphodiesterase class II)
MRTIGHPDTSASSGRLRQRLAELGAAVLSFGPGGKATLIGSARWEHTLVVGSPMFAAAVCSRWGELSQQSGRPVNLWPGLVLVPMYPVSNRKVNGDTQTDTVTAAMLLGTDFLGSEQLCRLCDTSGMDLRATAAKFDADALMSEGESHRLAQVIGWMVRDADDLGWRLHELHDLSWELAGSYEELSLLYKLSTSMVVDRPPQAFLEEACAEMCEVVGLRWLAIQLSQDEPGFTDLPVPVCVDRLSSFDEAGIRALGPRLTEALGNRTDPTILDDARVLGIPGLERFAHSLLVTPLHIDGKPLGLLYGADKIEAGSGLSTVDSKLCTSLGSSLSIYLKNVLLYEDMHSMFIGTLHALSTTIDAKDSYTQGHSERVALMSRQLAEAAGLDKHTVERVYLSGMVHDVGKIGVPEAVLTKPGKLTKEEYDLVKMHPETGARILEGIRQMKDLIPGVLHHHESWDGRGYPHGLSGLDIPLFGRIIGLADAFDAMSSDRTYRNAMPMHKVLDEVRRCSGKQFDPELADIFVGLDFAPYLDMIERHHDDLRYSA